MSNAVPNNDLAPATRSYLEQVVASQGELSVDYLYEQAKDPKNPLHDKVFNKDQADAAEAYYKDRVRSLVRQYTITIITPGEALETMRGFVNVVKPGTQQHVYVTVEKATTNPVLREQMLRNLQRDISILQRKYSMLDEYAAMLLSHVESLSTPAGV